VALLAGTVAFTGAALGVGVSPANALPGFDFDRFAGNDRFGTAASIAANTFAQGATDVVLANGASDDPRTAGVDEGRFPDALAGNYLAGAVDAPILLTRADEVPTVTLEALEELEAETVHIVGGETVVSEDVAEELEDAGYTVNRFGGQTRYDTARIVAEAAADLGGVGEVDGRRTAILGNGQNFPDILAAGPLAYAEAFPVTITPNTSPGLDDRTAALLDELEIEQVIIVGGPAAVTASAETEAETITGAPAIRLGDNTGGRENTARLIAEFALDELGFDETHVNLARSSDFADALTGGPHAGVERAPIIITPSDVLAVSARGYLEDHRCALVDGDIFGGFVAISPEVAEEAEDVASNGEGCASAPLPDTIDVTPSDTATATVTANTGNNAATADNSSVDNRTFVIDGLFEGETYRITLVTCANVGTDANGNPTFVPQADSGSVTGFGAATGTRTADITSINGTPTTDSDTSTSTITIPTATFVATGSTATFTVDGDTVECVVPVVYFDSSTADTREGGNLPRLEVNANGTPAEDVDVGGNTYFVAGPPPADSTPATATATATVTSVTGSATDTATIVFSEPIQASGATFLLRLGGDIVGEFVFRSQTAGSGGSTIVTLDRRPGDSGADKITNGSGYRLQFLNVRDVAGNSSSGAVNATVTGT
jgi:putative cell wall-binding protein